jgi:segregation and condensation protein B
VREVCSPWVSRLWDERPARYSRALMETLALIAYRQPITRGEVEDVRGVSVSTNIIKTLMEREWVRVLGHRDVPGRPALYGTTREFLDYFGLKSLDELPTLAELRDLDEINRELDLSDPDSPNNADGRPANPEEGQSAAAEIPEIGRAAPAEQDGGRSPTDADRRGADPAVDTVATVAPKAAAEAQTPPDPGQAAPAGDDAGPGPADADGESAPEPQRENTPEAEAPADMMPGSR